MIKDNWLYESKNRCVLFIFLVFLVTGGVFVRTQDSAYAGRSQNAASDDGKTVEVILKLEGKTVPGKPRVVPAERTFDALDENAKDAMPLELKETGENTWRCNAVEGRNYVIGWIAKKGWFQKRSRMFGYCSEPFAAREGLTVTFSPGMPATFEYDLRKPPEGIKATPAQVLLQREITKDGKRTFLSWFGGSQEIKRPGVVKITGLAAGKYKISARTSDIVKYLNSRTPVLYEDREIEIKPGSVNRFDPVYPEIDSTVEEGDVTIRGTLYGPDRKPLANKTVKVIPLGKTGFDLSLYYPVSKTDSKGKFEFIGIRPNRMVYVSYEDTSISLGRESLTENACVSADIVVGSKELSVVKGKPIGEIVVDFKNGGTGRLSDLKDKVVVLDVWATWCGPCKKAFPGLNSLAAEFSDNSNVVFLALSIDYDAAAWGKMVEESDWNALRHGRLDRKNNSYVFNKPIPYTVIVDKKGIVRAEGNGIDIRGELKKIGMVPMN